MFSKFAASTLRLCLQWDNMSLLNKDYKKMNKNGGPEEDRGLCVMWRLKARQDWVTKPWWVLVRALRFPEAGKSCTTSHSGLVHLR